MTRPYRTLIGLLAASISLSTAQLAGAAGLNFDFGSSTPNNEDNNGGGAGFSVDIGRDQDDGTVGTVNDTDYSAPDQGTNQGDNSQPMEDFDHPNPYPDNNYRPATPTAPVGPSNIFDPPTAETCRASVTNYARSYIETYQSSPSLNSQCGFQQLMEFNFFESFTLSGLIDGAFCGFARSIVNPMIDQANEHISTINSYIPSNAELTADGRWELNEDGQLELGADWSIYGGQAVSNFLTSNEGSYQYSYQFQNFNPDGDISSEAAELQALAGYLTDDPLNTNQNQFDDGPDEDFSDLFQNINNNSNDSETPGMDSGDPAQPQSNGNNVAPGSNGNSGDRITLGGNGGTTEDTDAQDNETVNPNGGVNWDDHFSSFFD